MPEWSVVIPLPALVSLQALPGQVEGLKKENVQLRRELDAMHQLYAELLQSIADLRHDMRKR